MNKLPKIHIEYIDNDFYSEKTDLKFSEAFAEHLSKLKSSLKKKKKPTGE